MEFQLENSSFASIDDLEFQGDHAPPLPTEAPVVQLTQPVDGINVNIPNDISRLDIAGTLIGAGLPSTVTVAVYLKRPLESANLPPLTLVLAPTGTGTTPGSPCRTCLVNRSWSAAPELRSRGS